MEFQTSVIQRLTEIVTPYAKNREALQHITPATTFLHDLKINSANLVDVVLDVEEAFDITIENEDMDKMLTVGSAIDIVNNKQKKA